MRRNRIMSYLLLTVIYALAAVFGVWIYDRMDGPFWTRLLAADVLATLVVFVFSLLFRNASVYDPYWSVQPMVILGLCAMRRPLTGWLVFLVIAVFFWGMRLTGNWAYNFHGMEDEDWRYRQLKEQTGKLYPFVNLFGIHLMPTLIVYACILPAAWAVREGFPGGRASMLFCVLSLCAASLQGIADLQMHSFRAGHTGGIMNGGLWRYSRHPNYLGEILMWWGVGLAVFCASPRPVFLLGAFANTVLFLCVSIPLAEKRQGRKSGWDEYKSETPMLIPRIGFLKK